MPTVPRKRSSSLVLDPAIELEEAVERVVETKTGSDDVLVVVIPTRIGVLVRLATIVEVKRRV